MCLDFPLNNPNYSKNKQTKMAQLLHSQSSIKLKWACAEDHAIFNLVIHWSCAVVFGTLATTVQLYPGQDTFEFDQGHATKNQPITILVLLSESLAT